MEKKEITQTKKFKTVLYRTLTSLHIGTNSKLYDIDCPIVREEHTRYPIIEASSLKGIYRKMFQEQYCSHKSENSNQQEKEIFGDKRGQHLGNLIIVDAKILIFPVRSFKHGWLFITCPYILERFLEEYEIFAQENVSQIYTSTYDEFYKEENIEIETINIKTVIPNDTHKKALQIIEEKYLKEQSNLNQNTNLKNLCVVGENIKENLSRIKIVDNFTFKFFVTMCMENRTRIRINKETGLVEEGALFTEEYVPIDTVFYNFISCFNSKDSFNIINNNKLIQIGGNKSLGSGFLEVFIIGGEKGEGYR